ncbi:MAG: nucleoside triphosphate pyrophosphohydrolase [Pseudomonadales bacterium]|jgi:ATP diphosphatase|nr:nucleoside triphosphate pyrophosphohydrolase [Pseudomonadales bacterium]
MSLIDELLTIMATLRDPERGCAWDLKQNFDSIAPYTIEEAFEVAQAIAERDWSELREELGDLLLQVVFHARMAEEQGLFCFADVVTTLNEKLVRRHPHVFGDAVTRDVVEIKQAWEQIKQSERANKGKHHNSALDGVPAGLPALQRAAKIQKKAAVVGFDWPDAGSVLPQVQSELDELSEAMAGTDPEHVAEELGDLLFSVVNLARKLKLDPELVLRRASDKFSGRFRYMEEQADLTLLDSQSLEHLWRQAKVNPGAD